MLKRLFKGLWRALLIILLVVALLLLAGRLMIPTLATHRAAIEQLLSGAVGSPVVIGAVVGRWQNFGPEIELHDLQLLDPQGKTQLRLSMVRANLHLIDSLRARRMVPREVTLSHLGIVIRRNRDRSLFIAGLHGVEGDAGLLTPALFGMPSRLRVEHATVRFEDATGLFGEKRLSDIHLSITGTEQRFQVDAELSPGSGSLRLAADLTGDPSRISGWSGTLHASGSRMDLVYLLDGWLPGELRVKRGVGQIEAWSHWRNGRLTRIRGNMEVVEGQLGRADHHFDFDRLSGQFAWQRHGPGWQLNLDQLNFARQGHTWKGLSEGEITFSQPAAGVDQLSAQLNLLELDALYPLIRLYPALLPDTEQIGRIAPQGRLENLAITLNREGDRTTWSASGALAALRTQSDEQLPAVDHLSGHFEADHQGGRLLIDSEGAEITFPALFRAPLPRSRLLGEVRWRVEPEQLHLESDDLYAQSPDVESRTRFQLDLPTDPERSPLIDLQTDFQDGDVAQISRYLPASLLDAPTVEWLDSAIVGGHLTQGSCLLRGPLWAFPFADGTSGHFEVLFNVEGGTLDYLPDWPPLQEVDTRVRFLNNRFDAWSSTGQLYNSRVDSAHVWIESLDPVSPLRIKGVAKGPLGDALRLLRETPLSPDLAQAVADVRGRGQARVSLDLTIPLEGEEGYRLDGELELFKATLEAREWDLTLSKLRGKARFDLNGVYARGLSASVMNTPTRIRIFDSPTRRGYSRIEAKGEFAMDTLATRYPAIRHPALHGTSPWTLQIDLPPLEAPKGATTHIEALSDLVGTAISLPPPLGKPAEQAIPFRLVTSLRNQVPGEITFHYGALLSGRLKIDLSKPEAPLLAGAELALGDETLSDQPLPTGGIHLRSHLKRLDLAAWSEWLDGSSSGVDLPLREAQIDIDEVEWQGGSLSALTLNLEGDETEWRGRFSSSRASGNFTYPKNDNQGRAEIALYFIKLPSPSPPPTEETPPPAEVLQTRLPDPTAIPEIHLTSDQLIINDTAFGPLEILAERLPDGLAFTRLQAGAEPNLLSGTGKWVVTEGAEQETLINLDLKTDSLGQLLSDLGLAENLRDAPAVFTSQLSWPGGPVDANATSLSGWLGTVIGQGSVPEMEPGLGRLFGLFNLGALGRRLTLDFSDLFGEGFSFDRIDGDVRFESGEAHVDNLLIDGPAARIRVTGTTDLAARTFDHRMVVSGKLFSTLPLAGTLTGGPAVGAALLIVQQLMGDSVDSISATEYQLIGPWDAPVLERSDGEGAKPEDGPHANEGQ